MRGEALLVGLLAQGCAGWRDTRVPSYAVSLAIMCDVGQTYYESDGGAWDRPGEHAGKVLHEMNPVLGPTPSPATLGAVLVGAVAVNTAVGFSKLPPWARWAWVGAVGAAESYVVATHLGMGGVCGAR